MSKTLRHAVRSLAKRPGFSLLIVLLMALCIGANASVFSAAKAVLLNPLPIPAEDRERLVMLTWIYRLDGVTNDLAYVELEDWKRRATLIEEITPVLEWGTRTLTDGEVPERLSVSFVAPSYFKLLGVKPQLGRLFLAGQEEVVGSAPVIVLSDGLWERRFGRDAQIVGKSIQLNGLPYTVVGVAQADFWGISELEGRVDAWLPAAMAGQAFPMTPGLYEQRLVRLWAGLARIKPGAQIESAQAEAEAIAAQMEKEFPDSNRDYTARLIPLREHMFRESYAGTRILFAGALLVLLIGCVNIANLLMVRKAEQRSELALHLALGSGRGPLIRQVLSEGLVLALCGGAVGILLAYFGTRLLARLVSLPTYIHLGLDSGVLAFAAVAALCTGLVFSLPAALAAASLESKGALQSGGIGSRRVHSSRGRGGLLVFQTAVVVVLLVIAGLLGRSFQRFSTTDLGFNPQGILTMRLVFDTPTYSNRPNISLALRDIVQNVRALPGVNKVVAWGAGPPAIETQYTFVRPEGGPEDRSPTRAFLYSVSPGALEMLGIPLLQGREFTEADSGDAPWTAVMGESLAKAMWPGEDPIGKRLHTHRESDPWVTVVGLIPDTRLQGRFSDAGYNVLFCSHQWSFRPASLLVDTRADSEAMTRQIREAVAKVDRQVPIFHVAMLPDLLRQEEITYWRNATVVGAYGALALAFSVLGLYGMLAYFVTQRRQEIGVRIALGAGRGSLIGMVMKQGLTLAGIGLAAGLVVAFATSRLLSGVLYGVSGRDVLTFVGVALLFSAVALIATYLPARAATKVEPTQALRLE